MFQLKVAKSTTPGYGDRIEMYGPWVTPSVWDVVNRMMGDNWNDSPIYKAKQEAGAFFQGGSNNREGEWVLLEFWQPAPKYDEFVRLLNQNVDRVLPGAFTRIPINLYDWKQRGALELCVMIAEETECPYDIGTWGGPFTFFPEDNVTYNKVMDLVRTFELTACLPGSKK